MLLELRCPGGVISTVRNLQEPTRPMQALLSKYMCTYGSVNSGTSRMVSRINLDSDSLKYSAGGAAWLARLSSLTTR